MIKNIEKLFKVDVIKVNIVKKKGKLNASRKEVFQKWLQKSNRNFKKGQSIDLTTGI